MSLVVTVLGVSCAQDSGAQQPPPASEATAPTEGPAGAPAQNPSAAANAAATAAATPTPLPAATLSADALDLRLQLPDMIERVMPSVVGISTRRTMRAQASPFGDFAPFFGRPNMPQNRVQEGQGSAVIVSADGVLLTNNHVIEGADHITVSLSDGRQFEATVIGSDPQSDIAMLRMTQPPGDLVPITFGDSDRLRLGESVIAIGNPFGLSGTVTLGIISAKGRANVGIVDYEDFIQTDAAINPGNSGGALVNLRGELIGINTAILSRTGGYQGVGFAIPSNMAQLVMEHLLADGKVTRGWLGVMIQNLTPELVEALGLDAQVRGAVVSDVQAGSPAELAGVQRGDVITRFAGSPVSTSAHLRNAIALRAPGTTAALDILRDGQAMSLEVTLGDLSRQSAEPVQAADGSRGGAAAAAIEGLQLSTLDNNLRTRFQIPQRLSRGVVVTDIDPQSPAARLGLRPGDVVLEVNRRPINSVAEFGRAYEASQRRVLFLVYRGGATVYLTVTKP